MARRNANRLRHPKAYMGLGGGPREQMDQPALKPWPTRSLWSDPSGYAAPMSENGVGLVMTCFLAVTFLQSGLDKVLDRKGNVDFMRGYFEKTPLRAFAGVLLGLLTLLELAAGVLCAGGALLLLLVGLRHVALLGAALSCITFLALFTGTRLAKDYQAAAGLVPYFLLGCATVLVLGR
jgi:hypothetical protein